MGFGDVISISTFLFTPIFLIVGIVFLFLKNGKAKKMFRISGIVFSVAIVSFILTMELGFWLTTLILVFLSLLALLFISLVYLFTKNGKAKKMFKVSGIFFAVTIVSFLLGLKFDDRNVTQTTQTVLSSSQGEDASQDTKKKVEAKAIAKEKAEKAEKKAIAKEKAEEAEKKAIAKEKAEEAEKKAIAREKAEEAEKKAIAREKAEEAEKKEANNQTIFDIDWETYKKNWYNSMNSVDGNLSVITDKEEKQSAFTIRHDGQLRKALFVSVNTDEITNKIVYAVVIGTTNEDNVDVFTASANLIKLTDPTLPVEIRKQIVFELGLSNGIIINEKSLSYSYNGITYNAEYEHELGSLATLTVSAEKE